MDGDQSGHKDGGREQRGVCSVCGHETVQPIPAGSQTEEGETATVKRSGVSLWAVVIGLLAVSIIAGAALLIRQVLKGDDEEDGKKADKKK